jgi:hypothetical protein
MYIWQRIIDSLQWKGGEDRWYAEERLSQRLNKTRGWDVAYRACMLTSKHLQPRQVQHTIDDLTCPDGVKVNHMFVKESWCR